MPLTDDPSGPSLAMQGPDAAGLYALYLGRERVSGITADRLEASLLHLLARF